jgi:hypothetical protein
MTQTEKIMSNVFAQVAASGIPVAQICKRAKIYESNYWAWKRGDCSPSLNSLCKFVHAFEDLCSQKKIQLEKIKLFNV